MKKVVYEGKKENLHLVIDSESVNIYIEKGEDIDPIHIAYWHIEEVEEDADVAITIATAINLFHTDPQKLVDLFL